MSNAGKPNATPNSAQKVGAASSNIVPLEAFAAALPREGRLIGIDLGTHTLGLAVSDVLRMIASGLDTIRRTKLAKDAPALVRHCESLGVVALVLGFPISLDGSEGPRAQATRAFARNLASFTALPILLWDERLTTVAAERALLEADTSRRRRSEVIDQVAATIILQTALDRLRELEATA